MSTDIDFDLDREFQKHLDFLAGTDMDEPFPTTEEIAHAIDYFGELEKELDDEVIDERDFNDIQYPLLRVAKERA